MNPSRADMAYLRWPLLAFMSALLCGGGTIWMGEVYLSRTRSQLQDAQHYLSSARANLTLAQSDVANISIYAEEYALLLEKNIIAEEQRLDWMEALERLRLQYQPLTLKYTISPRQHYPHQTLQDSSITLHLSGLHVQAELVHELQLLNLFSTLRADAHGKFIIEHCTMERGDLSGVEATSANSTSLKADCSGGWLTMQKRGAS